MAPPKSPHQANIWITGDDMILGMFFTEAFHEFRGYGIYDGSDVARAAIAREKQLVEDGLVDPETAPNFYGDKAREDMTVEFRDGWIMIRCSGQRKRFAIPRFSQMSEIETLFGEVFRAMRRMLHAAHFKAQRKAPA